VCDAVEFEYDVTVPIPTCSPNLERGTYFRNGCTFLPHYSASHSRRPYLTKYFLSLISDDLMFFWPCIILYACFTLPN